MTIGRLFRRKTSWEFAVFINNGCVAATRKWAVTTHPSLTTSDFFYVILELGYVMSTLNPIKCNSLTLHVDTSIITLTNSCTELIISYDDERSGFF